MIPIDTINCYYLKKVKMVHSSTVSSFIYLCLLKPNNEQNVARMIAFLHEYDYVDTNNISGTYERHAWFLFK